MIRVFLIENVPGLGKTGEIHEVKSAYAYNFLLQKNLAVLPHDPRALALQKSKQAKTLEVKKTLIEKEKAIQTLNGKKFVILAKADSRGHLYGSIGPKEIAETTGLDQNIFKTHFKQLGVFPLEISSGKSLAKIEIEIKNI